MEILANHRPRQLAASAALLSAISIGLPAQAGATAPTTTTSEQSGHTFKLTPNMVGFLAIGSKTHCYNGGAQNKDALRPCAVLLRTGPELSDDIINANPAHKGRVNWPLEAYRAKAGNALTIECFDPTGQVVQTYEGNSASTDWYAVAVPESRILNPQVKSEISEHSPNIQTIRYHGQTELVGWASVEWFNQGTPSTNVAVCPS